MSTVIEITERGRLVQQMSQRYEALNKSDEAPLPDQQKLQQFLQDIYKLNRELQLEEYLPHQKKHQDQLIHAGSLLDFKATRLAQGQILYCMNNNKQWANDPRRDYLENILKQYA